MLPAFVIGLGLALAAATASGNYVLRVASLSLIVLYLFAFGVQYRHRLVVGNPDLAGISRAVKSQRVVLCGQQACVNWYYFPSAAVVRGDITMPDNRQIIEKADVVVYGKNRSDPERSMLRDLGFVVCRTLGSWTDSRPCYDVYEKVCGGDP